MAKILVVDDSKLSRNIVAKMARAAGHETLEAADGTQGLEKAATCAPDCIVLDLLMPEVSGFEVLRRLRDRGSKIPAIVLTADIQKGTRQQCMELGAVTLLNKPVKEDEIIEAIKKALVSVEEPCR